MAIHKFVAHSSRVLRQARRYGWLPAARYTNLRDVRDVDRLGFLDIDWKDYSFSKHLEAARATSPMITVARDITDQRQLGRVIDQAWELLEHAERVIVVPKTRSIEETLEDVVPRAFGFGYSVPTRYGSSSISPGAFRRPVHLLGGRPDVQRALADVMPVMSMDCNRFTLDAQYGDYFDGETFRPHPTGGYDICLRDSLKNINKLWRGYSPNVQTNGKIGGRHAQSR